MRILMLRQGKRVSVAGWMFLLLTALGAASAGATTGQEIFETNCAVCHGLDGTSILPNAPHFAKGDRLEKTDNELLATVSGGLNIMPPWKGVLDEQQMREVLVYVRSLAK